MKISFFVPGKAAPGGSKKGFVNPHTGRVNIVDDAKNNAGWKERVALFAHDFKPPKLLTAPLEVEMLFSMQRPKGHYRSGKNSHQLKATAPAYPTGKPDVLKLSRSTEDALTGVIWKDDSATVRLTCHKHYGPHPGVRITIWTMED